MQLHWRFSRRSGGVIPKHIVAASGLCFLVIGGLLLTASVYRGRQLCRLLRERMPQKYADLGSPLPGYFYGERRTAYLQFIMQRKFEDLPDPDLVRSFSGLRRFEVWQLAYLIAGFAALGVAFVWLHW